MPIISLKNISKKYRIESCETTVLKNISLTINAGEMVAIIGASGSGKSTLMNLIGLLDKADTGKYMLCDHNVAELCDDGLALLRNHSIGFVFQQFNLLPRFTALQNVALPLLYRNISSTQATQQAMASLERVNMGSFAAHRPTQLSGGQQQRVAIARALVGNPQVILADEPTGALDSVTRGEIMALFLTLHREGRTLILITHDEQIALQCSKRISITDGQLAMSNEQP